MAFPDPPNDGGGGAFPFAGGTINQQHPLAPNLVFLGVAFAGGYIDLVSRTRSHPVTVSGGPINLQHSGGPSGAGWQFGTGTVSLQARAVFAGLNCNPLTAMNMAAACGFMNPIGTVATGGNYYLFTVESAAGINSGGLDLEVFSTTPRVIIGGNGGNNNKASALTTTTSAQGEGIVASNDTGTATLYTRTDTGTTSTASRTSASNVSQVTFSSLSGCAQRMILWGAVWNKPITAAQAALITPLRGQMPPGLVIRRNLLGTL